MDGHAYSEHTEGHADTMCENNDHLFGRGTVGQKIERFTIHDST